MKIKGTITFAFRREGYLVFRVDSRKWLCWKTDHDAKLYLGYDIVCETEGEKEFKGVFARIVKDKPVLKRNNDMLFEDIVLFFLKKAGKHKLASRIQSSKLWRKYLANPVKLYEDNHIDFFTLVAIYSKASYINTGLLGATVKYLASALYESSNNVFSKGRYSTHYDVFIRYVRIFLNSMGIQASDDQIRDAVNVSEHVYLACNRVYPVKVGKHREYALSKIANICKCRVYSSLAESLADGNRFVVLAGTGGTGKTTLAKNVANIFRSQGKSVALTAMTGSAAKRIGGMTLHKYLGFNGHTYNSSQIYPDYCLIIDEASMLTWELLSESLSRCSYVTLLVGDPEQLPPVGEESVFQTVMGMASTVLLKNVHRGEMSCVQVSIPSSSFESAFLSLCRSVIKDLWNSQVVCSKYEGRTGVDSLNLILQKVYSEKKVMVIRNIYDRNVLVAANGSMGILRSLKGSVALLDMHGGVTIEVPAKYVRSAYAISVHKSQGLEWDYVIYVRDRDDPPELIKTATTRARNRTFIVNVV